MKEKRITIFLAALFLVLSFTACGGENTAASMHLVRTEGKVQVDDAEGKSVKVTENLGLYSGYELSTQEESYGWITLDDTKLAKMDETSNVEIRKKGKQLELYVQFGSLFFNVTEPLAEDETMNIRTSTMAVGIRGTCGWVEVESKNLMYVYLLKGKLECTIFGEDGGVLSSETITAGQTARMALDGDKASVTVEEFDTQRLPAFVADALEKPEDWDISGDAEGSTTGGTGDRDFPGSGEDPEGTGTDAVSGSGTGSALDENAEVIDDIHVREESGTLYFSGTGVIHREDYEGYTPVNVVIEEGITGIGYETFRNCRDMFSVSLPASLESLGEYVFDACDNLTSIVLPDGLKEIGTGAFRDCLSLTSIALPAGLESVENYVFSGCYSLASATLPASLRSIGDYAFYGCSMPSVILSEGLTSIGQDAFGVCGNLTSITLPASLESLGRSAFEGCYNMTSLVLPAGLKSIGDNAFSNCGITSVTWPASLESIGDNMFYGCYSLADITLPDSLKSIGAYAFYGCGSLASVTLPDSLESIGDYAFYGCYSLTSLDWPAGLESIGSDAFVSCGLTSIILPDGLKSLGDNVFWGCDPTSISLPASIESIGQDVFNASISYLTAVRAPGSLRETASSWFYGYESKQNVFEWY